MNDFAERLRRIAKSLDLWGSQVEAEGILEAADEIERLQKSEAERQIVMDKTMREKIEADTMRIAELEQQAAEDTELIAGMERRIAELEAEIERLTKENERRAPANMEQLEDMASYIKRQDARIAELEAAQRWIPVTEEYPTDETKFVAWYLAQPETASERYLHPCERYVVTSPGMMDARGIYWRYIEPPEEG